MYSYSDCLNIIEKRLTQLPFNNTPVELYDPIRYTLSMGGKRIRPCLAIMAHFLYSDKIEEIINPALGIEVFHNFTLLHDDIMDNSSLRRNYQTVHVKWNNNVAILSGDTMMILAYHLISNVTQDKLPRITKIFNDTALEVCEGQQMDMNFELQDLVSEAEYLEMIRLKTAVLLAASLAVGGITGGAPEEDINNLYNAGTHIGIAFQLQDDYLDVFADTKKFGKEIGNDIVSNKKTYLYIKALNSTNKNLTESLTGWINRKSFNPLEKIRAVTEIYKKLGVDRDTQRLADDHFSKGLDYLNRLGGNEESKEQLKNLIISLKRRER